MASFNVNIGVTGQTIKALRRKYSDRGYVWTGADYVAVSGLSDAEYLAAMTSLTAISTSQNATGSYVLTVSDATEREWIEFYANPTAITDVPFAVQDYEPRTDLNTIDGIVDAILVDTGTTLPAAIATLDALIDKFAPRQIGTLSGAGTGTEVATYGGVTATYTVDSEGNISAVEFS